VIGTVAIEPDELAIVREIVDRLVPAQHRVYVFGSRATGIRLKPWSDLDLAIEGPKKVDWSVIGRLDDAFDQALLDWKVDVIDLNAVSPEFRRIVDAHKVPLP
jgi:predicted nucleotidyltransferase